MNDPFQMQRELRYGAPVCDQILIGRHFTIGYSYFFRQAKWVLEIIDPNSTILGEEFANGERMENFRADQRIPWRFRASLGAYKGSGYDRGHLAASANLLESDLQNSETFLLSNMSPQKPQFNRQIWRKLEESVRDLNEYEHVMETYVLTAPVFDFDKPIKTIGDREDEYGIDIPIPHGFIKSVFAETDDGDFILRTFKIPNEPQTDKLSAFLIKTYDAEQYIGGRFWDRVSGGDLHQKKKTPGEMWGDDIYPKGPFSRSGLTALTEKIVVIVANHMGIDASVADRKGDTIDKILAKQNS